MGTSGHDVLYGTVSESGALAFTYADVVIRGLAGPDTINGQSGEDWILPGTGEDIVDGGPDADFLILDDSAGPVTVDLAAFQAREAGGDSDTIRGIENVAGSPEGDEVSGDEGENSILGMDRNDALLGGGANDTLFGGNGSDTLDGGADDDFVDGGYHNDAFPGSDTATYASAPAGVTVSLMLRLPVQRQLPLPV